MESNIKCKKKIFIFGDKGYQMKKEKLIPFKRKHNNLKLIVFLRRK